MQTLLHLHLTLDKLSITLRHNNKAISRAQTRNKGKLHFCREKHQHPYTFNETTSASTKVLI